MLVPALVLLVAGADGGPPLREEVLRLVASTNSHADAIDATIVLRRDTSEPITLEEAKFLVDAFPRLTSEPTGWGLPDDCATPELFCTTRPGLVLAVAARSEWASLFTAAATDLVGRAHSESDLVFARRLLAAVAAPNLEPLAVALLSQEGRCPAEAFSLLATLPTVSPATVDTIRRKLSSAPMLGAMTVASLAFARPNPWLRHFTLTHPTQFIRRDALARWAMSDAGAGNIDDVLALAACEPDSTLRREARDLVERRHLGSLKPCPPARWFASDGGVKSADEWVPLSNKPTADRACQGVTDAVGALGTTCIATRLHGEWGAELLTVRAGRSAVLLHDSTLQPVALLRRGDASVVVSRLEHLGGMGGLSELKVSPDGGASHRWLVETAAPERWGASRDTVFLEFRSEFRSQVCDDAVEPWVIGFSSDGGTTVVRSPATECLWR